MDKHSEEVVKAYDDVIGKKVLSPQGENLGKIEEVVLDKVEGNVRYVALSFGGILGLGDKLFALPWKAITYNKEEEAFILNIDKSRLESAEGFDKNSWPNNPNATWL